MRLARLLHAVSWKYAIGEVLLIVMGISIALAANSLYSDWQDHLEETNVLGQILVSLEQDRQAFLAVYDHYQLHVLLL